MYNKYNYEYEFQCESKCWCEVEETLEFRFAIEK